VAEPLPVPRRATAVEEALEVARRPVPAEATRFAKAKAASKAAPEPAAAVEPPPPSPLRRASPMLPAPETAEAPPSEPMPAPRATDTKPAASEKRPAKTARPARKDQTDIKPRSPEPPGRPLSPKENMALDSAASQDAGDIVQRYLVGAARASRRFGGRVGAEVPSFGPLRMPADMSRDPVAAALALSKR